MTDTNTEIDWRVTGVFDPETGVTFAYTTGLVDRGLPELHVWSQPTDGADPGAGWRLSHRDMHGILNSVASALVEGVRAVGDSWSTKLDSGLTTIHWRLDEPVDRDELQAFGAAAGATVAPLRWELERMTIATPDAALQATLFSDLALRIAHLPGDGNVASDRRTFGPAAAAVAEARRVARGCNVGALVRCAAGSDSEERWFCGTLRALLQAAGRTDWADAASKSASDDAELLAAAVADPDEHFIECVASMFESVLGACYLSVAAADLLPHLEPARGLDWAELTPNILRPISDPPGAETALGDRCEQAYTLVDRTDALAGLGEGAQRAAIALAWWATTRHGVQLDVHRWMDVAEEAGCGDDATLGAASQAVNAWAVAAMPGAPTSLTDAVVPFVEALR